MIIIIIIRLIEVNNTGVVEITSFNEFVVETLRNYIGDLSGELGPRLSP
jgi:hypothetical protein